MKDYIKEKTCFLQNTLAQKLTLSIGRGKTPVIKQLKTRPNAENMETNKVDLRGISGNIPYPIGMNSWKRISTSRSGCMLRGRSRSLESLRQNVCKKKLPSCITNHVTLTQCNEKRGKEIGTGECVIMKPSSSMDEKDWENRGTEEGLHNTAKKIACSSDRAN